MLASGNRNRLTAKIGTNYPTIQGPLGGLFPINRQTGSYLGRRRVSGSGLARKRVVVGKPAYRKLDTPVRYAMPSQVLPFVRHSAGSSFQSGLGLFRSRMLLAACVAPLCEIPRRLFCEAAQFPITPLFVHHSCDTSKLPSLGTCSADLRLIGE